MIKPREMAYVELPLCYVCSQELAQPIRVTRGVQETDHFVWSAQVWCHGETATLSRARPVDRIGHWKWDQAFIPEGKSDPTRRAEESRRDEDAEAAKRLQVRAPQRFDVAVARGVLRRALQEIDRKTAEWVERLRRRAEAAEARREQARHRRHLELVEAWDRWPFTPIRMITLGDEPPWDPHLPIVQDGSTPPRPIGVLDDELEQLEHELEQLEHELQEMEA